MAQRLVMSPNWQSQVQRASVPTMKRIGELIEADYKEGVGYKTGHLQRSTFSDTDANSGETTVGNTASYAKFHEEGTRRHQIKPRLKKALKFLGATGDTVLRKNVNHPGTKPNPALARAAFKNRGVFRG